MSTMASQITGLTNVYSTVYQAQITENTKAPCHWPLYGVTGECPTQKGMWCGKCFHLMTSSWVEAIYIQSRGHVSHPAAIAEDINSFWRSDTLWRHKSGSTLAQVMVCCLMAPSHYLNQCWFIITEVQWCSSEGNFTWDITAISH